MADKHFRAKTRPGIWIPILVLILGLLVMALWPLPQQEPIRYMDRQSNTIKTEKVAGEAWLRWLYHNPVGEATLWTLARKKVISSWYGRLMDRPSSADRIPGFIAEYEIDTGIAVKKEFNSFNDFFIRKLKTNARPVDTAVNVIVSPADGKILAYKDVQQADFFIKGHRFDVRSFLKNDSLSKLFEDGSLVIVRLAPNDYHRFHFPVDATVSGPVEIPGHYYSVNPIALKEIPEIFLRNKRALVTLSHEDYGQMIMAEVGATMVGSIVQTFTSNSVYKGEEKGYFKFGGSTVVLLFMKDMIDIDSDLLENTKKGLETIVSMGERIGQFNN
jgi:phosphatidylserine decarboxylase